MAYAFKRIEDALNQPSESNIFGTQDQTSSVVQNQPDQSGVKTSTSGDLGASNQAGSSNQKMDYNQDYSSDADVLKLNVGKTSPASSGVQKIGEQIAQNKQTLQDRADQYMQGVKEQNQYDVSEDTLKSAITGDDEAYKSLSTTLYKPQANYRPEFEGAEDLAVKDIDLLQNQAGIRKLASRGQGPRYTSGMGAFDAALMQRDPEFQRLVAQTREDNQRFEDLRNARADELEAEAQQYADTSLSDAQTTAEDFITNYRKGLDEQNRAELQAFIDSVENLDKQQIYDKARDDIIANLISELEQVTGYDDLSNFIPSDVSVEDYVGFLDPTRFDYRDFIDEQEAEQFNRIASLLGGGETFEAGRAPTEDEMYQIDRAGLRNALLEGILGGKQEYIDKRTADIQRDIDLARSLNLNSDLSRDFYERILPEREAAGEQLSTTYRDGELITPEEEMVERLANYRMLKDRYGENFGEIYDPYASASGILDILEGRV